MARFTYEPIPDYRDRKYMKTESYNRPSVFDPKRYEVQPGEETSETSDVVFHQTGHYRRDRSRILSFLMPRQRFGTCHLMTTITWDFIYGTRNTKVLGYEIRGYNGYRVKQLEQTRLLPLGLPICRIIRIRWIYAMCTLRKADMISWRFIRLTVWRLTGTVQCLFLLAGPSLTVKLQALWIIIPKPVP